MASKSDWENAYRDAVESGRTRVGPPPTPEELVAWSRGELPESEAERMRDRLAYYPDLATALSEDDEAVEDEAPILTREHLATDWELIQHRMAAEDEARLLTREQLANDWELIQQRTAPVVSAQVAAAAATPLWRPWIAAIPVLATVLFAGLWVRSLYTIDDLREQLEQPRENVERVDVYPSVPRGGASPTPVVLQPSTKSIVFTLNTGEEVQKGAYRVEIRDLDAAPPAVIWKRPVIRSRDGTVSIVVPRSFLPRRSYEINLYAGTSAEPITTIPIWIVPASEAP